jgi:hypothetical protein
VRYASKVGKGANMTPKLFFQRIFIWELKNAAFDADFESIEKREKIR